MPLRLMEIFLPENDSDTTKELFENETTLDYWKEETFEWQRADQSAHFR